MLAVTSLLLSLALSVSAAPARRQSSDNGACQALQATCTSQVSSDLTNAWSIKACVFGASCFGGQRPVDDFLAAVYSTKNGGQGTAPQSVNLPRVTTALLDSISTDGQTVSQQNFIDGFYSSLDESNGPYPTTSAIVISYYGRVATWTAFCTSSIPFRNFADYFQYSASVNSPGCAATTTSSAPPAVTTIPVVSSDPTCQKLFVTCVNQIDQAVSNPWANEACLFGASCLASVQTFLTSVFEAKNPGNQGPGPSALVVPRVSTSLFDSISTDGGNTLTQQNFIDGYYGELSSVGGPFPPNSSGVIGYFNVIRTWTAFCPGQGIPYMNFADYFEYSSSVAGGTASCT